MKKLLLFAVLVLAFTATAYSQDVKLDFRASGFIDFRTEAYNFGWSTNYATRTQMLGLPAQNQPPQFVNGVPNPLSGGEWNKTSAYLETRMRLKFDAIMGKELSGTIFFEADSSTYGDYRGMLANTTDPNRNSMGSWNADNTSLEIKNVYFDVAVPYIPVPTTVRFGIQPFGIRSNMFAYFDGAGVTAAAKFDPVQVTMSYAKMAEGLQANSDDADLWSLQLSAKIDTFTIGGWGFYMNARQYPLYEGYLSNTAPITKPSYGTNYNSMTSKMWWLGAYADGKLGPVNINFDFVYDNGWVKTDSFSAAAIAAGADDKVKYSGWASRLKVDFPWEAFNFGVVGYYGTGGDANKMDAKGQPGNKVYNPSAGAAGVYSSKNGSYVVPPNAETGAFNEGEVLTASYINDGYTGFNYFGNTAAMTRGSNGGIWLAKLYASYKVTPDLKMTLQGLYFGDTTKNGDTFGTRSTLDANGVQSLRNSSTIGYEIDLINEWQVYKNLVFRFGGGVLWAGDALKFWNGLDNQKPDTPWIITTRLTYSF
jgi:hypothetical protein